MEHAKGVRVSGEPPRAKGERLCELRRRDYFARVRKNETPSRWREGVFAEEKGDVFIFRVARR